MGEINVIWQAQGIALFCCQFIVIFLQSMSAKYSTWVGVFTSPVYKVGFRRVTRIIPGKVLCISSNWLLFVHFIFAAICLFAIEKKKFKKMVFFSRVTLTAELFNARIFSSNNKKQKATGSQNKSARGPHAGILNAILRFPFGGT